MQPRSLRRVADVLTVAVVIAILVGTLSPPGSPTDRTFGLNPSLGHLGLFGALGVTSALRFAVSRRARRFPRSTLGMTFFAFWLLAAGTEYVQGFVGRDPSFIDWLIDMASATGGFLGGSFVLRVMLDRNAAPLGRAGEADPEPELRAAPETREPRTTRSRRRRRARGR